MADQRPPSRCKGACCRWLGAGCHTHTDHKTWLGSFDIIDLTAALAQLPPGPNWALLQPSRIGWDSFFTSLLASGHVAE